MIFNNTKSMIPKKYIAVYQLDDPIRDRIKDLIKKRGLSQRKVAELSNKGISYPFLAELLSGKVSGVSSEKLEIIANILDVSIEELLIGSAIILN